jgi:hypothetical protein
MGFWSTVGDIAKGAADTMATRAKEAEVLAEDYRREDDDYLKENLKMEEWQKKWLLQRFSRKEDMETRTNHQSICTINNTRSNQ